MAKFKKSTKKSTGAKGGPDPGARLTKTLSESASQIWLAGMGAFGRAQAEGTKLFDVLVKEGMSVEQSARKLAGGRADAVRDAVENRVSQTRDRAADTWDKLEKVFEDRVQRALTKLGVPGRDDLNALMERVDALNAELRRANGARAPRKTAAKAAPRRTAKAVRKTAPRKGARKPA